MTLAAGLVLCADGGGTKVQVVIRAADGTEARGHAGSCNISSLGFAPATANLLTAVHAALAQLPPLYRPAPDAEIQAGSAAGPSRTVTPVQPGTFRYAWLALAGVTTSRDADAFALSVHGALGLPLEAIKVTNDVNLLAAPALSLDVDHVVTLVCGTGTVGRAIRLTQPDELVAADGMHTRTLPMRDVGVTRGWGYVLCDEGSAFWMGRLAMRSLLKAADRAQSPDIYADPPPAPLPLHTDLLALLDVAHATDLIGIVSLTGNFGAGLSTGEACAKRNVYMASAARVVMQWAFGEGADAATAAGGPGDVTGSAGTKGASRVARQANSVTTTAEADTHSEELFQKDELSHASIVEARRIAQSSAAALAEIALEALGDRTVVRPDAAALALGGGLLMSPGYRRLLLDRLEREGVEFKHVIIVDDAASAGARALAKLEFA